MPKGYSRLTGAHVGRASKGERTALYTRVAPDIADRVADLARDTGQSISDLIATILAQHLGPRS